MPLTGMGREGRIQGKLFSSRNFSWNKGEVSFLLSLKKKIKVTQSGIASIQIVQNAYGVVHLPKGIIHLNKTFF